MKLSTTVRRPNPRSDVGRENLLVAATKVFLAKGYQASVEDIVASAGVVRQTLYNHFEGKDAVFAEVIRRHSTNVLGALEVEGDDLRAKLIRFATILRTSVLSEEAIALHRMMIAEAKRFPSLARSFNKEGRGRVVQQVAALLAREASRGHIVVEDPDFAAEMLLTLLVESDRAKRLFGVVKTNGIANTDVPRIVDFFLSAFSARPARCPASRQPN